MPSATTMCQESKPPLLVHLRHLASAAPSTRLWACQQHGNDCDCFHHQLWANSLLGKVPQQDRWECELKNVVLQSSGHCMAAARANRFKTTVSRPHGHQMPYFVHMGIRNCSGYLKEWINKILPTLQSLQALPVIPQIWLAKRNER